MPRATPGLRGNTLYDNRDKLVQVYPELVDVIEQVDRAIEKSGCKGCARSKHTRKIVSALVRLQYDGRDLRPLEDFMDRSSIDKLMESSAQVRNQLVLPEDDCPHCVQKHLCAVFILMNEYISGYKTHLTYAQAHYEEAVREGYKGVPLKFENMTDEKALEMTKTLATQLGLSKDRMFMIGALAVLGELTDDNDVKAVIRSARTTMQPIKPPEKAPDPVKELPSRVLIKCKLCPGDILMLTAAVRDLKLAVGNKMDIMVDTTAAELWKNNPHINIEGPRRGAKVIHARYTDAIDNSNQYPHHFIEAYRQDLEKQLGIPIRARGAAGCIFLSEEEKQWDDWMVDKLGDPKPYWLINAGGKSDVTNKWWPQEYWQEVVDALKDRITLVQVGKRRSDKKMTHMQYELDGTVDLSNKTTHRQLIQLLYHSLGVTCGVTYLMHLSAAVQPLPGTDLKHRACVVIAGGREPAHWEMYQHHVFLHNCGLYPCNRQGGCWKARTVALNDTNKKRNASLCKKPVSVGERHHAQCMMDITPDMVIQAMNRYLDTIRNPYA